MARRFLALRMLGTFDWPPLPGVSPVARVAGAVEVFMVPGERGTNFLACVRWTPKSGFPQGEAPDTVLWRGCLEPFPESVYTADLNAVAGDGSGSFFLSFASTQGERKGVRLRFAGGTLLEQFRVPDQVKDAEPATIDDLELDLRVPLQPDHSAIEFGQPENTGMALTAGLALGLGESAGAGGMTVRVVRSGRGLVVNAASLTPRDVLDFDTLVPSPPGGGNVQLGRFLLARPATAASPYVPAPGATIWPRRNAVALVLKKLGLTAGKAVLACLDLGDEGPGFVVPTSAGLWVDRLDADQNAPAFTIMQRLCLSVSGSRADAAAGEDLRVRNGRLELRLRAGFDRWTDLGSRVNVLADLAGAVHHGEVWQAPQTLTLSTRLTWWAQLSDDPSKADPGWASALLEARQRMAAALVGLGVLEASQPVSLLPAMSFPAQAVAFAVTVAPAAARTGTVLGEHDIPGDKARTSPGIELRFPLFERPSTKEFTRFAADLLPSPWGGKEIEFSIALRGRDGEAPRTTIGGLAFGGVRLADVDPASGSHHTVLNLLAPVRPGDLPALSMRLVFQTASAVPIAVDRAWGDNSRRTVPLLLSEAADGRGGANRPYTLVGTEGFGPAQDRRLDVSLEEHLEGGSATSSFVLISEAPFALRRSIAVPLSARGDETSVVVAEYGSDTRQWQARTTAASFRYVLPPQSVGESADKPGRLDLRDGEVPYRDTSGGVERRLVEFRLTPPAELRIRPSDVQRSFTLPEWAASDIFRQRGELGLGAALAGLRAEFVYGLPIAIDPALETGPSRSARVAEIEVLVGQPVTGDDDLPDPGYECWQRFLAAYASRPERLEIWANDPDSRWPFAPARFTAGSRAVLRQTALHRNPVDDTAPGGGSAETVRFHASGLSGGALWPIESRRVLEMVVRSPEASSSAIEGIALSPLGGDASQTARFANNRVSIVTETQGGYLQRHKVEVIGRIATFWHRAKHVVVYERTVNEGAQFVDVGKGAAAHSRRPVLRKVSEYIEILQPERRYPDTPMTSAGTNALLVAVRFAGRIIKVDSAWGEDVGEAGYAVPLWNLLAARERPQVYPRPDIAFVTHAEGGTEQPEGAQECLNPENIRFFANTSDGPTDDTDAWPPCFGVDTCNLEEPGAGNPAAPGTSPTRVPPGFGRFTWRLAPPTARSTVNAGRADTPVYAALETLTFTRGGGGAPLPDVAGYANGHRDLAAGVFTGVWTEDERPSGSALFLPRLAAAIGAVSDAVPKHQAGTTESGLKASITSLQAVLKTDVPGVFDALAKAGQDADALAQAVPKPCERLRADLVAGLDARVLMLRDALAGWEAGLLRKLDGDGEAELIAKLAGPKIQTFLESELAALVGPAMRIATGGLGRVQDGAEIVRATIAEAGAGSRTVLEQLKARLRAVQLAVEDGRPWSEARVDRFERQLGDELDKARVRLDSVLADARQRVAGELTQLGQQFAGPAFQALSLVRGGEALVVVRSGALVDRLDAFSRLYAEYQGRAAGLISAARAAAADAGRDPGLRTVADDAGAWLDRLSAAVSAADASEIAGLVARLRSADYEFQRRVDALGTRLGTVIKEARAGVDALLAALARLDDAATENVRTQLKNSLAALRLEVADDVGAVLVWLDQKTAGVWRWTDALVGRQVASAEQAAAVLDATIARAAARFDLAAEAVLGALKGDLDQLQPDRLAGTIVKTLLDFPAVGTARQRAVEMVAAAGTGVELSRKAAKAAVEGLAAALEAQLAQLGKTIVDALSPAAKACEAFDRDMGRIVGDLTDELRDKSKELAAAIGPDVDKLLADAAALKRFTDEFAGFAADARRVGNELAQAAHRLDNWGEHAAEAVAQLGRGKVSPGNVLRAMAAVGSAPELPNLGFSADRIGYYYGKVADRVDTTPVNAWFGRLGDGLKAMGIDLPIRQIGDHLIPDELDKLDIGRVFGNFGGLGLDRLFQGAKLPPGAKDAIKLAHGFDRKTFRAWVQVDVAVALAGRRSMVSFGPFTLDTVDAKLSGFVRLEASKDSEQVEQTGLATLTTDLDVMIAGQSMVTLGDVAISYGKGHGLHVAFDPKKLRLSPSFQFIQNTLQAVFGDEFGGFEIIKDRGIPVGLRHSFAMPPLSLTYGTSGVQNLQISNRFELTAYPDFVIANRFALARQELPFTFTIFIIGGSGWMTVDVEYRPFERSGALMVVVEAAAGGAGSLAFAFAGVTGSVLITISVKLSYRKLIGERGGGLTVSLVVVITGVVDVLRIVSALITVSLSLSYRDNGDIDAQGSFKVTIRISRFFRVHVAGEARYRMSGGRTTTTTKVSASVEVTDENLKKARKLLGQGG